MYRFQQIPINYNQQHSSHKRMSKTLESQENPLNSSAESDPELVDLPEEPKPRAVDWVKAIITPKMVILFVLAMGFLGHNIYVELTKPPSTSPPPEIKETQLSQEMHQRFWEYGVLTAVLFAVFVFLKRHNDKADEKALKQMQQKEEAQVKQMTEKQKKIQQKADRIFLSFDSMGNPLNQQKSDEKKHRVGQSQQNDQKQKAL